MSAGKNKRDAGDEISAEKIDESGDLNELVEKLAAEREKLCAEAEKNLEEIKNLTDDAARARADFYNYRTRVERERDRDRKMAAEHAVMSLLPVLENIERIAEAVEEKDDQLHKGIVMVAKQFLDALCSLGLEPICTDGDFDPSVHEAVAVCAVDESRDGAVTACIAKGYKLAGKVIKAAQVQVGKAGE